MCVHKEEWDVSVAPENSIWLWQFRRINFGGHLHKCVFKTTFNSILKLKENKTQETIAFHLETIVA